MKNISKLMEYQQNEVFLEQLRDRNLPPVPAEFKSLADCEISAEEFRTIITAGLTTQALHIESRIASLLGLGFYTIGPCGEELLGAVACNLEETDPVALHYRHLATSIVRHMRAGRSIEDIILARARGYTVSVNDPVTGGKHCALGGLDNDFVVTSTLASQAPPAVGRALGGSLAQLYGKAPFGKKFVSYVSVGDGSVNNAHFLSAVNLAEYAIHRKFYCPVVFGISDNNISISLPGYNWLPKFLKKLQMPVYQCNGCDVLDVLETSRKAISYSRKNRAPSTIVYSNIPRRFGHAATDRQAAYFTPEQINKQASANPLAIACSQAIQSGAFSYSQLERLYTDLSEEILEAFQQAINEPKITSREDLINKNSQPLAPIPTQPKSSEENKPKSQKILMRKHMTQVIDESLRLNPNMMYIGEDVKHGGYYLVTEDLHAKYPDRVRDFPPDETTLIGCGMGMAQSGLLPVVEIPYAKYLDCGADMFYEAAITNWLSDGKAPLGMIFRLQGFDKGVFGGNFHTHNVIPTPVGIDVVCYSNGEDYTRGFRHAVHQAKNGRIVMSVDSTNLLYLRDLHPNDDQWRRQYPAEGEMLSFDEIIRYGEGKKLAIVAYGNAVYTALQAKKVLEEEYNETGITVIDSPYLSDVPQQLHDDIAAFDNVVFADVCKERQGPLAQIAMKLHTNKRLAKWSYVAACPTYNPLGTTVTFLNVDDIVKTVHSLKE